MIEYDLDKVVLALVGSAELVEQWWHGENTAFGGDTPDQVFRLEPERVVEYLLRHVYEQ
jgi:hypothetical protein